MTTARDLCKWLDIEAKDSARPFAAIFLKDAANYIRAQEARIAELEMQLLTERGAKAWKDVPDATAFVEDLRGNLPELTKDAERLKFFDQIWRWQALKDGEIVYQYGEHVPSLFKKTAELLPTHPPAPKAATESNVDADIEY